MGLSLHFRDVVPSTGMLPSTSIDPIGTHVKRSIVRGMGHSLHWLAAIRSTVALPSSSMNHIGVHVLHTQRSDYVPRYEHKGRCGLINRQTGARCSTPIIVTIMLRIRRASIYLNSTSLQSFRANPFGAPKRMRKTSVENECQKRMSKTNVENGCRKGRSKKNVENERQKRNGDHSIGHTKQSFPLGKGTFPKEVA